MRLDADDLLTPGSVARALAVFAAYPSVGLVYGHPIHFTGDVPPPARDRATHWSIWPGSEWLNARCSSATNVITAPEAVLRRSALEAAGPWQRDLRHTHDFELWLRMAGVSDVAYIHGADQAWHRVHAESLSSGIDPVSDLLERKAAFELLFGDSGSHEAAGGHLREAAFSALAKEAVVLASRELDWGRGSSESIRVLRRAAMDLAVDPAKISGWAGLERRMARGGSCVPVLALWRRCVRWSQAKTRELSWRYRGVS